MSRWIVFIETQAGVVEGFDKESAMRMARRQFGEDVIRVQSEASVRIAEGERKALAQIRARPQW